MNRNILWVCVVVVFMTLSLAAPTLAGGWATITLDEWPAQISANEPEVIGFTVRQHGRDDQRMTGLSPTLTAKNAGTGEFIIVEARAEGAAGHYVATITFPVGGTWSWSIQAFTMDQPMPSLTVSGPEIKSPMSNALVFTPLILAVFLWWSSRRTLRMTGKPKKRLASSLS